VAYAGDDDAEDSADFMFLAVGAAFLYFFYQLYRGSQAAAAGGGYFAPAAPPPLDTTEGFLDLLIPLRLSETGRAYIQSQENFSATPYPDGAHMSIYWGHQIQPGETFNGTRAEGDAVFDRDVARYEKAVSDALQVQVSQSQFDSLVDFCYDVGIGAFLSSTLLRLLNQGDFAGASQQFSRWVYSSGRVNSTLQARRADDLTLFQQA
jgi:lysozyme